MFLDRGLCGGNCPRARCRLRDFLRVEICVLVSVAQHGCYQAFGAESSRARTKPGHTLFLLNCCLLTPLVDNTPMNTLTGTFDITEFTVQVREREWSDGEEFEYSYDGEYWDTTEEEALASFKERNDPMNHNIIF